MNKLKPLTTVQSTDSSSETNIIYLKQTLAAMHKEDFSGSTEDKVKARIWGRWWSLNL